ncbi:hypothetical protein [Collimonas sp. PA-H2]|uniref:hypothetical protein n=1 Tax=Collimonas sp. PA-H2 TaxID=1881062 RepID=UPI001180416B|nr:hypothetical protein [Collimonas sp. PA-H2]
MGNVLMASGDLAALPVALQNSARFHRLKRIFKWQSAAFMAALMTGNWPLFQQPITTLPARYCRSADQIYSVGDIIKTATGAYRECFQDSVGTQPYWGEETRPRSRSASLM